MGFTVFTMNKETGNELNHLPKDKTEPPLGKCLPVTAEAFNSFVLKFERRPFTNVSDKKDCSQMLKNGQNAEGCNSSTGRIETTDDDSSKTAWSIKIFLN
jgi:hypothetical protein